MCWSSLKNFDLFAKPVKGFNVGGKDKIVSKFGCCLTGSLVFLLLYYLTYRIHQVLRFKHLRAEENVIKHAAIGREWDVRDQLSNFAFSARLTKQSSKTTKT